MMSRAVSDAALRAALDRFLEATDPAPLVARDPVALVRAFSDPSDQEVAGLLVAALAYGRASLIQGIAGRALGELGASPARAVDRGATRALEGFVYRFQRGDDLVRFLGAIRELRRRHGSIAAAFAASVRASDEDYAPAIDRLALELRGAIEGPLTNGLRFLLPRAEDGAAKRWCLYLRWMIRPRGPVDLGAWPGLEPSRLLIPLDTHIHRIGRYIGLTDRASAGLATAREITARLRRLRPEDPLAYDLALCHLGISGACPRRRDVVACRGCPIRAICRLGKTPRGWSEV